MTDVAVRHLDVVDEAAGRALRGLRIAHVSDLHFRKWSAVVESTQKLLATLDYDVLAITGDFAEWPWRWPKAVEMTRRFLAPLVERSAVYATLGNHDHPSFAEAEGLGVCFLRDAFVVREHAGQRYRLAGVEQVIKRGGNLSAALGPDDGLPTILLAHYPSTIHRLPAGRVALQLSGHTHGGQWRFPYVGCLWGNDRIHPRYAWGLHRLPQAHLHVSAGIGTSLPVHARLNCPPEITILSFRSCP